nr:uncharacterized protein LOC109159904 [Ipomoea trifida]
MNCIVWNCQGAGGRAFHRVLKNLIQTHKPTILSLVEPKVSGAQADLICKKMGYSDWVRVEAVGFSGGIWTFWNDSLQVSVISTHPQFVILQVRNDTNNPWFYAVVYGSPTHHLRRRLWAELTVAKQNLHGPLLVAGDFNAVTNREDTDNYTTFSAQRSSEFAEWIHSEGLVDMGYFGPKFTWVKILSGGVAKSARLDRALCNVEGRQLFPEAAVSHLPRVASDHAPILIRVAARTTVTRPFPFRFQAAWFTNIGLDETVKSTWNANLDFCTNITHMGLSLAEWNKNVFAVLSAIGGFIGRVIKMDDRNFDGSMRVFFRVRIELEVAKPLKKGMRVKKDDGEWAKVDFKYERLPTFCFICGILGNGDRFCQKRPRGESATSVKSYGPELRAGNRRNIPVAGQKWVAPETVVERRQWAAPGARVDGANFGNNSQNISNDLLAMQVHGSLTETSHDTLPVRLEKCSLDLKKWGGDFIRKISREVDVLPSRLNMLRGTSSNSQCPELPQVLFQQPFPSMQSMPTTASTPIHSPAQPASPIVQPASLAAQPASPLVQPASSTAHTGASSPANSTSATSASHSTQPPLLPNDSESVRQSHQSSSVSSEQPHSQDVLAGRRVPVDVLCPLYRHHPESLDHLMKNCEIVVPLWQTILTNNIPGIGEGGIAWFCDILLRGEAVLKLRIIAAW